MTDCNGCGGCCSPVVLPFSQMQVREAGPAAFGVEDYMFVLNDLTRIPYREGMARSPHLRDATSPLVDADGNLPAGQAFYECRWYDSASKECTNYENRPPLCVGYPWYGNGPNPAAALPHDCSYREDIPVTIGRRG